MHFGYNGKQRERIDSMLKSTALMTLSMQSVTGEVAFGGRSNQFVHNEGMLAIIFEYEANRYAREGNPELAGKFGVYSIPTLVVLKDGKVHRQVSGARPKDAILALLD